MNVFMTIWEYGPGLLAEGIPWNNAKVTETEEWHIHDMTSWLMHTKTIVLKQIKEKKTTK